MTNDLPIKAALAALPGLRRQVRNLGDNVQRCGWCGGNLLRVIVNRKKVWTHEDTDFCRLLGNK